MNSTISDGPSSGTGMSQFLGVVGIALVLVLNASALIAMDEQGDGSEDVSSQVLVKPRSGSHVMSPDELSGISPRECVTPRMQQDPLVRRTLVIISILRASQPTIYRDLVK